MSGVNLQAIYNRLNSVPRYHPMSAKTFADWSMEAGDIVTVSRGGTSYQSPVGTSTLKWSGKQQIQIATEGSRERDAISRISARKYAKGGGGGSGMRGTQELYWEMFSEDGQLHAQIQATAEQIQTEITNLNTGLTTRIDQTDKTVGMSVGRTRYTTKQTYSTKDQLPPTGNASVLYHISSTNQDYIWDPSAGRYQIASVDSDGYSATYIKTGEIALAFNEQTGQTEAKLDADVIYAGRGATTLADLELPDWMDTTEGLIATKATIVDLNALRARVGTLEADTIKTSELNASYINSLFSGSQVLSTNYAYIRNLECTSFTQGEYTMDVSDAVSNVKIESTGGNTYTLYKKHFYTDDWVSAGNFSRAVASVIWSWSGGMAKAVLTPQNQTFYSKQLDAIQPHGQVTWDTDNKGFTVTLDVDDTDGTTAFSDSVHFSTLTSYNAGVTEGEGAFTPATVTLQGSGRYVTAINANTGIKVTNTLKYNAGSGYTLYEGGDWYDYYDVGSSDTLYKSGGDLKLVGYLSKGATVSDAGTYYRAVSYGTGDNHLRGSSVTPTRRTGYRRGSQVTGTNQGSAVAVYVSDTNGTQYYQAGDTSYVYSAGSTVSDTYYTKIS